MKRRTAGVSTHTLEIYFSNCLGTALDLIRTATEEIQSSENNGAEGDGSTPLVEACEGMMEDISTLFSRIASSTGDPIAPLLEAFEGKPIYCNGA